MTGAISSVGQSYRLITGWSGVRVPDGPPFIALLEHFYIFVDGVVGVVIARKESDR